MKKDLVFSIIIPYFNRKDLLYNTLFCLNNQQMAKDKYEVIIVDDNSDDINIKIIKKWGFTFDLRYVRNKINYGSGKSRNIGAEISSGTYLIFLDCDLIVNDDYLSKQLECFLEYRESKIDILQVGFTKFLKKDRFYLEKKDCIVKDDFVEDIRHVIDDSFSAGISKLSGNWFLAWSNNISLNRDIFFKVGRFCEKFEGWGLEDCEFAYRIRKMNVEIYFNSNIGTYHQFHKKEYNENLYEQWRGNLNFFKSLHKELPVYLLEYFEYCYNPNKRSLMKEKDQSEIYLMCFMTFERNIELLCNEEVLNENLRIFDLVSSI